MAAKNGREKVLRGFTDLICKIGRHIKYDVKEQIYRVYNHRCQNVRRSCAERRKDEGVELEEHIIRIDRRIVHNVRENRHKQERDRGGQKLGELGNTPIGVIARQKHHQRSKKHRPMIEEGVEARKGNAGVVPEDRRGIKVVDRAADKAKRADIARARAAKRFITKDSKGHCVQIDAAGIKGQKAV